MRYAVSPDRGIKLKYTQNQNTCPKFQKRTRQKEVIV